MWDTLSDWFLVGLKSLGWLYLAGIILAIIKHFYVKHLFGHLSEYLGRKIKLYQTTLTLRQPVYMNSKNIDIVASILTQLFHAVEERKKNIKYHASLHKTVFLRTTVMLPFDISDVNVYHAIDYVKMKFYATYGTYLMGSAGPRNDIVFEPINSDGWNLGQDIKAKSLEEIVAFFERNPCRRGNPNGGFKMVVTLSILTDRCHQNYDFSRFLT